jgi:putative DNA primase/helicase
MTVRRAELLVDHIADLHRSGLSDDTISAMQVHSMSAAEMAAELGYRPDGVRSALVIPYPSLAFARYKLFPAAVDNNGHAVRYLQKKDTGVHLYIVPTCHAGLTAASSPLYYTEGEKKAAKATQEGFPCIGLGGLWNWLEAGTADGIAELDSIVHVEREEIIVPDSDVWTRPDLLRAVFALGKELESRGARVSVVILPCADGGKVGVDDFLVAHDAQAFSTLTRIPLKHPAFTKQREWYPGWKTSRTPAVAAAATGQGTALTLSDPEPWPTPVDGAALLDAVMATFSKYIVLPDGAAAAVALWVLHTYLIDGLHVSPILAATSPQKRCGKSTLLDVLRVLVRRALGASNISAAALFRVIETMAPTLLIDEADTFLGKHEELRGILNAGHTRSTAQVVRTVGDDHEPRMFRTFCPKAIAAIGELPGTIEDRAIKIRMKRRAPGEPVDRLRRDRIEAELDSLRRQSARWAADNTFAIREADPNVPGELNDRAMENWRGLLAIADAAGGAWPDRSRRAALLLSGTAAAEDSDMRVLLLADILELFEERSADKLASESIIEHLVKLETRPWAELRRGKPLTSNGLARLLRPFGVSPKTVRIGETTPKGYERGDFTDAWARYLPAPSSSPTATSPQPASHMAETVFSQPQQDAACCGSEKPSKPLQDNVCGGVAVGNGELEEGVVP